MLWTQLALVAASAGVFIVAMTRSRYAAVSGGTVVLMSSLVVLGAALGLIALNRRGLRVPAVVMLAAPAVLLVMSLLVVTDGGDTAADLNPLATGVGMAGYFSLSEYETARREVDALLAWMNWSWWLLLAAAALGVVSSVSLFRLRGAGQADTVAG
ncbi:hypothetical protein ALI144C_40500 [Actinosynnema sp. ALI-1.44]|nr:hypothetical protein ALI144C_40500 [Actinosynnema sp. ALI-1.44]